MVMAMTGIGAITRLTESGLSITEWNVVTGTVPPLNNTDWQIEFDKYQATPEFSAKHSWMTVDDFKGIYFWEWFHRFWGRLIGIAFAVPFIFFMAKGWIPQPQRPKYIALFILGGAQGALGWFMVKSGLSHEPNVSHFRLAAHLSLALLIYSALIVTGLQACCPLRGWNVSRGMRMHGYASLLLVALTIIWGAFVAGLDAGMMYNTFPLMGERLTPPELGHAPFLSDSASVQFVHRCLAMLTGLSVFAFGMMISRFDKKLGRMLSFWVLVQIGLGIATLLSVVWIPVAVLHQLGAVVLLTLMVMALFYARSSTAR